MNHEGWRNCHYAGNGAAYTRVGDVMGRAMAELLKMQG